MEQLPAWQSEIEELYQENADFQEMCDDYEQVRCLLATWTAPTNVRPDAIEECRMLLKALEADIMEALQTHFQQIESPKQDAATQPNTYMDQGGDEALHPIT